MDNVIRAIDEVHRRADGVEAHMLLEATAGQGTCLGCRFEQLGAMIRGVEQPDRLGVCIDTCHLFAAGYPLTERADYLRTFGELDKAIGLDRIKAFHLNDGKKDFDRASTGTSTSAAANLAWQLSNICSTTAAFVIAQCTWRLRRELTMKARIGTWSTCGCCAIS